MSRPPLFPLTQRLVLSGPDGTLALSDTQVLVVENGFGGAGLNRLVLLTLDPL